MEGGERREGGFLHLTERDSLQSKSDLNSAPIFLDILSNSSNPYDCKALFLLPEFLVVIQKKKT